MIDNILPGSKLLFGLTTSFEHIVPIAGVGCSDFYRGVCSFRTGPIACLELLDERDLLPAHKADFLCFTHRSGQETGKEGAFLFFKNEAGAVGEVRAGVIYDGKFRVRKLR